MGFIKQPFLPENEVSMVLMDYRTNEPIRNRLEAMGIHVLLTTPCESLQEAVKGHPDLVLHPVGDSMVLVAPEVLLYYQKLLTPYGFEVIKGERSLTKRYPGDIAYDVLRMGRVAFHTVKWTDQRLRRCLECQGVEILPVKQGYTKCSVCPIGERLAITSDEKLAIAMRKQDIETLCVSADNILLPGYDHGFLGGASGMLGPHTLAVTGRLEFLQEYKQMEQFLQKYGISYVPLSEDVPLDVGSIIPLTEKNKKR